MCCSQVLLFVSLSKVDLVSGAITKLVDLPLFFFANHHSKLSIDEIILLKVSFHLVRVVSVV